MLTPHEPSRIYESSGSWIVVACANHFHYKLTLNVRQSNHLSNMTNMSLTIQLLFTVVFRFESKIFEFFKGTLPNKSVAGSCTVGIRYRRNTVV